VIFYNICFISSTSIGAVSKTITPSDFDVYHYKNWPYFLSVSQSTARAQEITALENVLLFNTPKLWNWYVYNSYCERYNFWSTLYLSQYRHQTAVTVTRSGFRIYCIHRLLYFCFSIFNHLC